MERRFQSTAILKSATNYLRRPSSIAAGLFFFAGFSDGMMMPFFALWARGVAGVPTEFIGPLLACYAGGELLATPFLGGIADRVGRRPVLLVSTTGLGLGFLLLFASHGAVAIAATLILIGVFESVLHPTILTVIADTVPADAARRHFASARVMSSAGGVLGPATGALLALGSLGDVFLGCAASLLLAAAIVFLALPETRSRGAAGNLAADDDDDESLAGLLPAFRDPRLARLLLWFMLLEMSGSWIETVLPLYAHDAGNLTPSGVGLLFTYGAVLIVLFQLGITRALARVPGFWLVLASGATLVGGFFALLVLPGVAALIVGVTLYSLARMLIGPLIPATVNELAPSEARATYMAAVSVGNDLKDTLGPATGTFVYAISARLPWFAGMPLAALAAAALAFEVKRHEFRRRVIGA